MKKFKLFKKRKSVPMTPLVKPVLHVAPVDAKHERVVKKEPKKTGTHVVNMVTKKFTTKSGEEYDFETLEKFKKETGKRAIYGGNVTKAFREWLDQKHA